MMTNITATIIMICNGLLNMCRSSANRVPSGINSIPQRGHLLGLGSRTSECIGHT
jgi:hypothetical protein